MLHLSWEDPWAGWQFWNGPFALPMVSSRASYRYRPQLIMMPGEYLGRKLKGNVSLLTRLSKTATTIRHLKLNLCPALQQPEWWPCLHIALRLPSAPDSEDFQLPRKNIESLRCQRGKSRTTRPQMSSAGVAR